MTASEIDALDEVAEYDRDKIGETFGVADAMAAELMFMNDEGAFRNETPEERFARMREWVSSQITSLGEQSWAHHIDYGGLNGGTYWLSWTHKSRNRDRESIMNQNRETDYKGALRFAKKWGLPAPPPPDVYPFGPSGRLLRTKETDDGK